jgi:DNA-binding SARP family transcriptional activator/TolB-like protein
MNETSISVPGVVGSSMPRFDLRCWGEFSLVDQLRHYELPRGRKARAILAYVAAQGAPVRRERLAGLLWSERSEEQARTSLRQTLVEVRPLAADAAGLLAIDRDRVGMIPLAVAIDVARLEALARADDPDALTRGLAEKGDPLFGGLDGLDPAFDDWLRLERRVRQDRLLALGAGAAMRGLDRGAYAAVSALASELQALDEAHEGIAQIGMRADHALGDHAALHRRFRRLCEAMTHDLGEPPSPQTEALFRDLGARGPAAAAPGPARRPGGGAPTIAVLPFANRSGVPADDLVADGLSEDLGAALCKSPWLTVVASRQVTAASTEPEDLWRIGRRLGARYLLEGGVRRLGERLRIITRLVQADTGAILWTQTFDPPLADLPAKIAAELGVQAHLAEMGRALENRGSPSSWEASLRADAHIGSPTMPASHEAAVEEHARAVANNPDDGVAYASLAAYQGYLLHWRGGEDPDLAGEIARNIDRARELDPKNPWVLVGVALALAWMRRPEDALAPAERAVALNPSHDPARYALATILVRLGRPEAALAEFEAVERLAPNSISTDLASRWRSMALLQAERSGEALDEAERALRLLPGAESQLQRMLCLALANDRTGAREAARALRQAEPAMSRARIENLVRDYYCGSKLADRYVDAARRAWDDAAQS